MRQEMETEAGWNVSELQVSLVEVARWEGTLEGCLSGLERFIFFRLVHRAEQVRLRLDWDWGILTLSLIYNGSNPRRRRRRSDCIKMQNKARNKKIKNVKKRLWMNNRKQKNDWNRLLYSRRLRLKFKGSYTPVALHVSANKLQIANSSLKAYCKFLRLLTLQSRQLLGSTCFNTP